MQSVNRLIAAFLSSMSESSIFSHTYNSTIRYAVWIGPQINLPFRCDDMPHAETHKNSVTRAVLLEEN